MPVTLRIGTPLAALPGVWCHKVSAGTALGQCWDCIGSVLGLHWVSAGTALGQCWDCIGSVLGLYWSVLGLYWVSAGTVLSQC